MIVLIDLDGTLRDTYANYCTFARFVAPELEWDVAGPDTYWFLKRYTSHPKYRQLEAIWQRRNFFASISPYPDAIDAVQQAAQHCDIFLVTHPFPHSTTAHSENAEWVKYHFGDAWGERLIQTADRTLLRADYLVDDKPDVQGVCKKPTWKQVVFSQPYNKHVNIMRFSQWNVFDTVLNWMFDWQGVKI